jgi:poly(3-hydroxybutyrate) depolymerase
VSFHPATTAAHGCAYDGSVYAGIRLRARGRGRLRMMLADANNMPRAWGGSCPRPADRCHDRPGVWLELGEEWKSYEFPFCAFTPEGWGGSREGVDPSQLFGLHFRIAEREAVDVWLEDVAFYRAQAGAPGPQCGARCPLEAVPRTARIDPTFSYAPLGKELSLHTFEQPTKSCGPLTRRYLSYVPSTLGPRSAAPVLIMLHGSSANAESARTFLARDRFDALAARDRFIVVYGNAAPGSYTSPDPMFPNTGVWRQSFFDDGEIDDVQYLEMVLADLEARSVIAGDNPVLLTGLSNGGGMVLEAARRIPDRLLGVAALMPFDGDEPKPVPDLSRATLRRLLLAYSIDDPGMSQGYHAVLALQPARWAAAMGIPAPVIRAANEHALPDVIVEGRGYRGGNAVALGTRSSRAAELDMVAPDGGAQVRVLVFDHAGHFWPNPQGDSEDWVLEHWGFRNQDLDAADTVWEFLRTALGPDPHPSPKP